MTRQALEIWVVYNNPKDFPGQHVVRKWLHTKGQVIATPEILLGQSLEAVRDQLPPGLVCLQEPPGGDPVIVESWI